MGNFEKLSVLVIVVIIVMILVVAIYTWTDNPDQSATTGGSSGPIADADIKPGGVQPGGIQQGGSLGGTDTPSTPKWDEIFNDPKENGGAGGAFGAGKGLEPIVHTPEPGPGPVIETPPEPTPTPEPASDEPWMYTVKSGDTLSEIAMRELGSIRFQSKILALNPGLDPNSLRIGQQIKMPAKTMGQGGGDATGGAVSENPPKVVASGSAKPTPGEHYVTRSGDTLERIAKRAYGTIEYWGEIWASNLKTLETPGDIRAGMKLFIPKVNRYARPN